MNLFLLSIALFGLTSASELHLRSKPSIGLSIDNIGKEHNAALDYIGKRKASSTKKTFVLAGEYLVETYGVENVEREVENAAGIFKKSQSNELGELLDVEERPKAMLSFAFETEIISRGLYKALLSVIDNISKTGEMSDAFEQAFKLANLGKEEIKALKVGKDVAQNSGKYWKAKIYSNRRYLLPKWLAVVICDAVGALVGYATGGPIGGVILGAGASIEAAR
mmetsp:Transcript_15337/g.19173  ORF Transcript_15337/g.19173 Transcript_15337/m.19173 type:complete len:223 (+) Transcript_15337:134-802(+)